MSTRPRNKPHLVEGRSHAEVLQWYFKENPEMRDYVDFHIDAGTCAMAVTELLVARQNLGKAREEQRIALEEQRRAQTQPTPPRHPDHWAAPLLSGAREISSPKQLIPPTKTGAPGRPTSMHLVRAGPSVAEKVG